MRSEVQKRKKLFFEFVAVLFVGGGTVLRGRNQNRNADLNKRLDEGAHTKLDALFEKNKPEASSAN